MTDLLTSNLYCLMSISLTYLNKKTSLMDFLLLTWLIV